MKIKKYIQFTRHCARAPITHNDIFDVKPEYFPNGLGKCTSEGKFQHYVLGKYLKSILIDMFKFTEPIFNSKKTIIKSDTSDRVIESAYSFLESFYPKNLFTNQNKKYRLPPISGIDNFVEKDQDIFEESVKTTSLTVSEHDYMLGSGFDNCEYDRKLKHKNKTNNKQFLNDAVKELHIAGIDADFNTCLDYGFELKCYTYAGYDLSKFTEEQKNAMLNCSDVWFNKIWAYGDRLKLRVGPALEQIKNDLFSDEERTLFLYFTHDTNIAPLMNYFNMADQKVSPAFASNFSVTLFEVDGVEKISLLFENYPKKEYSVDEFKDLLEIEVNYREKCELNKINEKDYIGYIYNNFNYSLTSLGEMLIN